MQGSTDERSGAVATPPKLAEELARRLVSRWRPATEPRVLDPACGEGALLAAAWRIGHGLGLRPARLHGIERDPVLAQRARKRLRRLLGGAAGEQAARNVITADALASDLEWPAATHVIANPPWVSFSGRQASSTRRRDPGKGWPSLHGAFLERIARHVASEGTAAGVLLPASLCDGEAYGPLRERVTEMAELAARPHDLGEDAFAGVVEPAVIVELRSRAYPGDGTRCAWRAAPDDPRLADLERFPRLPPPCYGDPGVHTGNAASELIVRSRVPGLPLVREGRDLSPFWLAPPRLQLDVALPREGGRRFRFGAIERYRSVPVLIRQTADRPIAALHTAPTFFRNSLLACRPPPELDPAFVVAVLNSKVAARWHRLSFRDARQRTFPQVKVSHLRSLPMPFLRRASAPELHDRVADLVRAMAERPHPPRDEAAEVEALIELAYGL